MLIVISVIIFVSSWLEIVTLFVEYGIVCFLYPTANNSLLPLAIFQSLPYRYELVNKLSA